MQRGRASVVVGKGLLARIIRTRELAAQIEIHRASPFGDGEMILDLSSHALKPDCSGYQDMFLDGSRISFRPGDEFVPEVLQETATP